MTPVATVDMGLADVDAYIDRATRWEDDTLARLTPSQRQVTWGDHWVGLASGPSGGFLFGRVATAKECADRERLCGADDEELADSTAAVREAHRRGYRLGQVYSPEHPGGEFQSVLLCDILHRITSDEFFLARRHCWDVGAMRRANAVRLAANGTGLQFSMSSNG